MLAHSVRRPAAYLAALALVAPGAAQAQQTPADLRVLPTTRRSRRS